MRLGSVEVSTIASDIFLIKDVSWSLKSMDMMGTWSHRAHCVHTLMMCLCSELFTTLCTDCYVNESAPVRLIKHSEK